MKKVFTSFVAFVFVGFLFVGGVNVVQNVLQNLQKTITPAATERSLLAYQ